MLHTVTRTPLLLSVAAYDAVYVAVYAVAVTRTPVLLVASAMWAVIVDASACLVIFKSVNGFALFLLQAEQLSQTSVKPQTRQQAQARLQLRETPQLQASRQPQARQLCPKSLQPQLASASLQHPATLATLQLPPSLPAQARAQLPRSGGMQSLTPCSAQSWKVGSWLHLCAVCAAHLIAP